MEAPRLACDERADRFSPSRTSPSSKSSAINAKMQTSTQTILHKETSPVVLPSDIFPIIIRHCHPADARNIRRLNKDISSVIATNDLVWGEARWRWNLDNRKCWRWAADEGHVDVLRWCLESGGVMDDINNYALLSGAGNGHFGVVKLLLEREGGANMHARDCHALCRAADGGHLEGVRLLLEKGADMHVWGDVALGRAAGGGQLDIIKLLLEKGVDANAQDGHALGQAARWGDLEVVRLK
ncbi:hypothetical protein HK104_003917, partial [Borealophlyctis nickersoniae]